MFAEWKLHAFSETAEMKPEYIAALFTAFAFFVSGAVSGAGVGETVAAELQRLLSGGSGAVFAIYFSLLWRRTATLVLQCVFSLYAVTLPLAMLCQLIYELMFSLLWSSLYTDFWRAIVLTLFLALPAAVYIICGARVTAHTLKNAVKQVRLRNVPRTGADIVFSSREMLSAYLSSWLILPISCAAEAVILYIAL